MLARLVVLVLLVATIAPSLASLSYRQLRELLESSIEQGHSDKEVAAYLEKQKLAFALSDALIEEFIGLGVGPKTVNTLKKLQATSSSLPPPDTTKVIPPEHRQPPPPSEEEQRRIIEAARQNALSYMERLPDYICLQLTRRYVDPTGLEMDWLKYDEVKARVSYVEQRENYEILSVNNQLTTKSLEELDGATSTGEFGTLLASLFDPTTRAEFTWARHSLLRGRSVWVFHVAVPQRRSRWRISYHREREITAGYLGLIYVDKETERVLRIQISADKVPADFPIREATTRLDYDFISIAGSTFLLPLKARIGMRESRFLVRNDVEFRLYRKFSAEATISFDEIENLEPLPEDEVEPQPAAEDKDSPATPPDPSR
jgi:hypothetical protein